MPGCDCGKSGVFRAASLEHLRAIHSALASCPEASAQAVSHGTTWSLYFRDPEGSRLEVFTQTPWYVSQPCRFRVDLGLGDDALREYTLARIRNMPGFEALAQWKASPTRAVGRPGEASER